MSSVKFRHKYIPVFSLDISKLCPRIFFLFPRKYRFSAQFDVNHLTVFYIFPHYQSLIQNRAHMCNILFIVFDILEMKITDEDSDQSRNV